MNKNLILLHLQYLAGLEIQFDVVNFLANSRISISETTIKILMLL